MEPPHRNVMQFCRHQFFLMTTKDRLIWKYVWFVSCLVCLLLKHDSWFDNVWYGLNLTTNNGFIWFITFIHKSMSGSTRNPVKCPAFPWSPSGAQWAGWLPGGQEAGERPTNSLALGRPQIEVWCLHIYIYIYVHTCTYIANCVYIYILAFISHNIYIYTYLYYIYIYILIVSYIYIYTYVYSHCSCSSISYFCWATLPNLWWPAVPLPGAIFTVTLRRGLVGGAELSRGRPTRGFFTTGYTPNKWNGHLYMYI